MNDMRSEDIGDLAIEALERTAMVLAEVADEMEAETLPPSAFYASIDYEGAASGVVTLHASEGFVRDLAAGMLGSEPEDVTPAEEGQQALNELANIVGGSIIQRLGADHASFRIGLPRAITAEEALSASGDAPPCLINAEEESLRIVWAPRAA